jgi:preprotein translocase subunit SecD
MKIRVNRFNIYFVLAVALAGLCGCHTAEGQHKKQLARLGLYLEVNPDTTGRSEEVPIFRENPVMMNVQKQPFLTEANIKVAKVIQVVGGFALSVQYDREGALLLEQFTAANRGKHLAVFSQWTRPPDDKLNKGRWLAAPKISSHISDGFIAFTPDATQEEAEQIALGLNNLARKLETGQEPKW